MPRVHILILALVLAAFAGAVAASQAKAESATIRIEPRPYHGAIVTLEQGVRVWRPMPPNRYVIVNPGGQTPLSLGLTDIRERSTSHNYFYDNTRADRHDPAYAAGDTYRVPYGYARDGRKHRRLRDDRRRPHQGVGGRR